MATDGFKFMSDDDVVHLLKSQWKRQVSDEMLMKESERRGKMRSQSLTTQQLSLPIFDLHILD